VIVRAAAKAFRPAICMLALAAFDGAPAPLHASAAGDSVRGASLFNSRCRSCHAADRNTSGPRIRGVFGRAAGSVAGFRYSSAMARAGAVWKDETLDAFLAAPARAIPGTTKSRGVANPKDRADLIAYLKTLTEH
jgi:cytochrome c